MILLYAMLRFQQSPLNNSDALIDWIRPINFVEEYSS